MIIFIVRVLLTLPTSSPGPPSGQSKEVLEQKYDRACDIWSCDWPVLES